MSASIIIHGGEPEHWEAGATWDIVPAPQLRHARGHACISFKVYDPTPNLSEPFKVARNLLSTALVKPLQKSASRCAEVFQSLSPFAARSGLVAVSDGQRDSKGKQTCPTKEFPGAEIMFPKLI